MEHYGHLIMTWPNQPKAHSDNYITIKYEAKEIRYYQEYGMIEGHFGQGSL